MPHPSLIEAPESRQARPTLARHFLMASARWDASLSGQRKISVQAQKLQNLVPKTACGARACKNFHPPQLQNGKRSDHLTRRASVPVSRSPEEQGLPPTCNMVRESHGRQFSLTKQSATV